MMPDGVRHVFIEIGAQQPFQIVGGNVIEQPAFVFAKRHAGDAYRGAADPEHLLDGILKAILLKPGQDSFEQPFQNQDIAQGVVSRGFDLQAKIVAQVLQIVLGNHPLFVQEAGKLQRADDPGRVDALVAQHGDVKCGVVGHDDVVRVGRQRIELPEGGAVFEPWFVLDHLIGDVVHGHGLDGDGFAGIEQTVDDGPLPCLEGQLAQAVIGFGAGGFGIQENEHDQGAFKPLSIERRGCDVVHGLLLWS